MNPNKNKKFGKLVTEAASARHIDQLPNIRRLIYEILQEAKEPEKVNFAVWLCRHIVWAFWDTKLEGLR